MKVGSREDTHGLEGHWLVRDLGFGTATAVSFTEVEGLRGQVPEASRLGTDILEALFVLLAVKRKVESDLPGRFRDKTPSPT